MASVLVELELMEGHGASISHYLINCNENRESHKVEIIKMILLSLLQEVVDHS